MKDAIFDGTLVLCLLAVMVAIGYLGGQEYKRVNAPKAIVVRYSGSDMIALHNRVKAIELRLDMSTENSEVTS